MNTVSIYHIYDLGQNNLDEYNHQEHSALLSNQKFSNIELLRSGNVLEIELKGKPVHFRIAKIVSDINAKELSLIVQKIGK